MSNTKIRCLFLLSAQMFLYTVGARARGPEDQSFERRVGRVSSIRTDISVFSGRTGKWALGPRKPLSFEEYDFYGNLTRSVTYKPDGSLDYEWVPRGDPNEKVVFWTCNKCVRGEGRIKPGYDEQGRIIREDTVTLEGKIVSWSVYKYDDAGNKVEELTYKGGRLPTKHAHTFDTQRNKIQTEMYDEHGELSARWGYRYDEAGQVVEETFYDSRGSVDTRTRYSYDNKGNLIGEAYYDKGDSFSGRTSYAYKYDSAGNWVERTTRVLIVIDKAEPFIEDADLTEVLYRTITYY